MMTVFDNNGNLSEPPRCKKEPIDLKQFVSELSDVNMREIKVYDLSNEPKTTQSDIANLSEINKVENIEKELLKRQQAGLIEKAEIEVKHYFVPGVYIRELFMPKGTVLTGKIHKYPQFHVITKGDLSVLIDGEMIRLKAPINIMSSAGAKRLAIANEDTLWLMVHGTYQTDLQEIEKFFTCDTEEEYLDFIAEEKRQLNLFRDEQC